MTTAIRLLSAAMLSATLAACGVAPDDAAEPSVGQSEHAICAPVTTATFGLVDAYAGGPGSDPNVIWSGFSSYMVASGVPVASQIGFDDPTPNRHVLATLRHGLRGCFAANCTLKLCFRAQAHQDQPDSDLVHIFNTNFAVPGSFPLIYQSNLSALNGGTWTLGTDKTLCIDLTTQMLNNQVGDMLQFHLADDSMVDYIRMTLSC